MYSTTSATAPRGPVASNAAVFDCDGLLLDSTAAWGSAFDAAAGRVGHTLTAQEYAQLLGSSVRSAAARIVGWAGRPDRVEEVAEALRLALRAAVRTETPRVLPGVVDTLARLRSEVPLAVASNAPEDILADMLAATGLRDAFLEIVSAETVSAPKPAPDVYLAACERLGADPTNSVAFEDSRPGALAAQAAGMSLVVVTSDEWPEGAPLSWPALGRPMLYVTSLGDPVVVPYVLGAGQLTEVAK
ncbi:HAD family hydrolase [Amycolatopsis pithecellobii]|uniref:HAD-IA family hydrolase n=1 Tax=Amycolatopsis pithecellobii TaxID=664692 RepID=A0A6N7Z2S7_9PSEU|nr:HAD family phosphatase [Amycolatopsis pithecellobii]MTD54280.1 HAD-IA family hydrolase [Amycolatopsis pithecellobii]